MLWINNMTGVDPNKKISYSTTKWPPKKQPTPFTKLQKFHDEHFVSDRVKKKHTDKWYGKGDRDDSSDEDLEQDDQEREMTQRLEQVNGPAFAQTFEFQGRKKDSKIRIRKQPSVQTTLSTRKRRIGKYD
jgi:hypothetical protein